MSLRIIPVLAAYEVAAIAFTQPSVAEAQSGIPGWFVIAGCFKSYNAAENHANTLRNRGVPANIVTTDDFPNFSNGWHCASSIPFFTRGEANQMLPRFRAAGVPDAYVKYAF